MVLPTDDPVGIVASASSAGLTIGLEEEFHVLDPETYELVPNAPSRLADGAAASALDSELVSSTVETASAICESLDDLRNEVVRQRRQLRSAADHAGLVLATAG